MKYGGPLPGGTGLASPPSRGAWIEMSLARLRYRLALSPPSRGAWIEIVPVRGSIAPSHGSPPSRGAWIEITAGRRACASAAVAPLAGGVD